MSLVYDCVFFNWLCIDNRDKKTPTNVSSYAINGRRNDSQTSLKNNKFGFSTLQYQKMQITKSSRAINLRLIVSLNRLKYSKFYFNVLKALVDTLSIINCKEPIVIRDWQSIISYIHRYQSTILIDVDHATALCEKGTFDKEKLANSRKNYFGDAVSETWLLKHWLNSKQIRSIVQFLFSIYNYVQDLRKRKPRRYKNSVTSSDDKATMNKSRKALLLYSNESKKMLSKNSSLVNKEVCRSLFKSPQNSKKTCAEPMTNFQTPKRELVSLRKKYRSKLFQLSNL